MVLIIGIDDAGRGPIIGPMILAGVLVTEDQEKNLKEIGVDDSKLLIHKKRVSLSELIKKSIINYHVEITYPEEIDNSLNSGINLNTLEAIKSADIIKKLISGIDKKIKIIIDCPSINTISWKSKLLEFLPENLNAEIICEHKADATYPSVSAASILAKVTREEEVAKLKSEFGNLGSGYPSDPVTKQFLKSQGLQLKDSGIFRKTWATWKNLFPDNNQSQLFEF